MMAGIKTSTFWVALAARLRAFRRNERGNVLILTAFALPPLLGAFGLGFEAASWYQGQRAMQNAADSAAVAAASNSTATYLNEARAVAAQYGFTNGVDGVSVTASNAAACPSGGTTCYSVQITRNVPLILSRLVGFDGDTVQNGSPVKRLSARAVAVMDTTPREYCILALAQIELEDGFVSNGAPKADLGGCNIMSNADAVCHGHNLNAGFADAFGVSSGCGTTQTSNRPKVTDPYSGLAANIPANACSSYPVAPAKNNDPDLPTSNMLTGTIAATPTAFCGDVKLTGNVTITGSNVVLIVRNGSLDLNGYTLSTAAGAGVTVVFTGDNNTVRPRAPVGNGTFDIAAPKTGPWSGVALYQDPALTSGVNIREAGNSPTWKITGLVYLPRASVTFSGAVSKSSNGLACFAMVVDNLTINGTGGILNHGQCAEAGVRQPTGQVPARGKLVA